MSSIANRISKGLRHPSFRAQAIKKRGQRGNAIRNVDARGYDVLRFTKGWLHVSAKRARLLS